MLLLKLALRNILNAGLRTWLNVVALSFAFVAIIFLRGFYEGLYDQVERATVDALYGAGQYWHSSYDSYDPLSLDEAHGLVPQTLQRLVAAQEATPILIRKGAIYPEGRYRSILIKGIEPGQRLLSLPSALLKGSAGVIPALVGSRMARSSGLKEGDVLTVQWRDVHGTFDARDVTIVAVFRTTVQEIDNEQIWIPLEELERLARLPGEATLVVLGRSRAPVDAPSGWDFKSLDFLLQDLHSLVRMKSIGGSIMYMLLLFLAMLAIFDTQILSIWRRKKEIGTLMAMGMTRTRVIGLFTLEGGFHSVLAAGVGALYGIPLIAYVAKTGFELPGAADSFGIAMGEKLFPIYSGPLIVGTTILVCVVTTVVSYLPARKIARLKPTDALRGRLS
jgi:putative ABC transport system permease protein